MSSEEESAVKDLIRLSLDDRRSDRELRGMLHDQGDSSKPVSVQLREFRRDLRKLYESTSVCTPIPEKIPEKPEMESLWDSFQMTCSIIKNNYVEEYLRFLNAAKEEDLLRLPGIESKRVANIIALRPFHTLDDLKETGLSALQIKEILNAEFRELLDRKLFDTSLSV